MRAKRAGWMGLFFQLPRHGREAVGEWETGRDSILGYGDQGIRMALWVLRWLGIGGMGFCRIEVEMRSR